MNYNTIPLPRILNTKDPITGRPLVYFRNSRKKYVPNPNIPVCRSGEEHLVENYELAKNYRFKGWVCHHRLELTLDGEFSNSAMDLVNKDMYYHRPYFELIWLRLEEHLSLHHSGDNSPSHERTGDKNPMYRITEDKHPAWKGDDATKHSKYMRGRRAKKRAMNKP